jgi:CubicO group peptidase (beta-lactamase class C family)
VSIGTNDRILRALADLRQDPTYPAQQTPARSLARAMQDYATPAVSIAIIDDFQVGWFGGFGTLKSGGPEEASSTTLFQAGSISKVVFALAVMKLAERGLLDLDEDVNRYLTSWKVPANNGWTPRVTLRQLLSHTAGTTVHGFPGYPITGPIPSLLQILQGEAPANTSAIEVDLLPGTQFRYSGGGTTIAQQAVVDVLQKPFADMMRELVLDPLGLTNSTFEQPLPHELAVRAAVAHPWNGTQAPGNWHVYPEMAAAGLWTTAGDVALLGADVMRLFRGDRSKLDLRRETVVQMLQPQLPHQKAGENFVGLGWFCSGKDDDFQFGHEGQNEGFLATLRLFPARGRGVVVMNNSIQGWRLRGEIVNAIGREFGWPAQPAPQPADASSRVGYAGRYRHQDGLTFEIVQVGDALLLRFDRQPPIALTQNGDEFSATTVNMRVQFTRTGKGAPASLRAVMGGTTLEFVRVD